MVRGWKPRSFVLSIIPLPPIEIHALPHRCVIAKMFRIWYKTGMERKPTDAH